jgi:peptidoglycan/xylan/chitin deacetylase (PgdA/CDA1 family)
MSRLALRVMRSCGLFALTRALSSSMARILMYHNFAGPAARDANALNVEGVRIQFEYLRRHFTVVPLQRIVEQLAAGRKLDPRMVALTIDDGRRNCYEFLFPLLKEFELPATFFVVSSFIRGEDWIWTDKVLWLGEHPNAPVKLNPNSLDYIFRELNRLPPAERNARIEGMAKDARLSIPSTPPLKYFPCAWNELREMSQSGLVEIGSHTATHPIMASLTDEESREELIRSKAQIEEGVEREVRSFCFPNGMPGDFRPSQVRQVEEAGYSCAVTAQFGMVAAGSDRYQLPRIGMTRKVSPPEIAKYIDGFAYFQQRMRPAVRQE